MLEGVSTGRKFPKESEAYLEKIAADFRLETFKPVPLDPKVSVFINLETMISDNKKWEGNYTYNVATYLDSFFNAHNEQYSRIPGFQTVKQMISDEHQLFNSGYSQGDAIKFTPSKNAMLKFLSERLPKLNKRGENPDPYRMDKCERRAFHADGDCPGRYRFLASSYL